ncbi:endophilin-A-like isoform X3 [Daphnia pulex]|uniref:endophilin-A-like isoform X3 n=1 Tax=Daphnia pulex TaxID=6669 RepID=UPI001EDD1829|nr:endophilin-A-like isoform X3 [Daphnia pulex]
MAFAGLKKQINKANQYVTEKMGAAEGTKMDDDFVEMERKTDVTYELVEELQMKTKEFLQPNPTARAKMAAVKAGISKLSGQAKAATYPQPEGTLGETMSAYGRKLGEESVFGAALIESGETMKQLADVKYALDDNVKQNFLEPLHHLQSKDLKEVLHHRKKLHGRRLDFDCKKRKQTKGAGGNLQSSSPYGSPARSPSPYRGTGSSVTEDEIRQAEEKFAESLHLAQMGMHNILDNDVEQIAQLAFFAEGLLEYHKQCTDILKVLTETLHDKRNEAASKPRKEFIPKTLADLPMSMGGEMMSSTGRTTPSSLTDGLNGMNNAKTPSAVSPSSAPGWDPFGQNASAAQGRPNSRPQPSATAVYDFDPENPGELGFKEGDCITLTSRIDENWFEGSVNGKTGFFPVNYVQVTVPLP